MQLSFRTHERHAAFPRDPFLAATLVLCGLVSACSSSSDSSEPPARHPVPAEEELPGGATTTAINSQLAYSRPLANLNLATADGFFIGDSLFDVSWVTAPASVVNRDGLGPLFNARSCSACHSMDGRGRPPLTANEDPLSLLFRLGHPTAGVDGASLPDASYGGQLQPHAVLGENGEAQPVVTFVTVPGMYPDGTPFELTSPVYTVDTPNYGALESATIISGRVAPAVFGLGLLAAISDAEIIAQEDPNDLDGDGISGTANLVPDLATGGLALGRYGWKAGQPNVRQQSAAAFRNDIGITTTLFPTDPVTAAQGLIIDTAFYSGGAPELDDESMDHMEFYMHTLAPPKRRNFRKPSIVRGRTSFSAVGCADCHTPRYLTGTLAGIPEVGGQVIFPYTDLLLHDMGPELADGQIEFEAESADWKTPPLWGLGLVSVVNGHNRLLHDGRARGVEEAILWHGGEGAASRDAFMALDADARAELIEFVEDL